MLMKCDFFKSGSAGTLAIRFAMLSFVVGGGEEKMRRSSAAPLQVHGLDSSRVKYREQEAA